MPEEDSIDIDGLLMDPWGDPSDSEGAEPIAYEDITTERRPDSGQAERRSVMLDEWQEGGTAEQSNGEMLQHSEIGSDPYPDRGTVEPYDADDGADISPQSAPQDDIWAESSGWDSGHTDGLPVNSAEQSAQPDGERFDQSDEDIWDTGEQANRQDGTTERQRNSQPAFQSDGETDIWGDFADDGQTGPSMMERTIPENRQGSTPANQSNSKTEPRRSSEPDIWSGGEPVEQEALTVAYDDVWDEEIPVQQPDANSETVEHPNGEAVKQSDDFFQRNSIFDGDRTAVGEDDATADRWLQPQTGDTEIWSGGETAEQEDGATVDLYSCFPSQQFDADSGLPGYDGPDEADADDDGKAKRIIIKAAVILAGVALLCGGGYFAYSTYSRMRDTDTASRVESQQEQDSLVKAQEEWDEKVAEAKELIAEIEASVVKDDESVAEECDKLGDAAEGSPMSEDAAKKKLDALNLQYDATDSAYRKALQSKSADVSDKLRTLIEQAEQLGDAPDSSDKETMNGLVEKWKGTSVTSDNVADVNKAVASLQSAVDKVSKAKTDAENAKKEEEERKKAEEEAQQQQEAQQQAQQQTQQQQYTYTYTPQQQYTYTPQQQTQQQQSQPQQQQSQSQQSPSPSTGSDGNSGVMF